MEQQTIGIVIGAAQQRWFKINRKSIRLHAMDGAAFPSIIQVEYTVEGKTYRKRKWLSTSEAVPEIGSSVRVMYRLDKPSRAKIL